MATATSFSWVVIGYEVFDNGFDGMEVMYREMGQMADGMRFTFFSGILLAPLTGGLSMLSYHFLMPEE